MAGIFDNFYGSGGGNGLLPFGDRWAEVIAAMQNGQFDPQGEANTSASLLTMPQPAPQPGMMADPLMARAQAFQPQAFQPGDPAPRQGSIDAMGAQTRPFMEAPALPQRGAPMAQAGMGAPGGPGFGDRLQAAGASFFNAGSPMQALGGLIGGLVTGQRQDPMGIAQRHAGFKAAERSQAMQTIFMAAREKGFTPAQAAAMAQSDDVLKAALPIMFPKEKEGFTLGEGQSRFDAAGRPIASVAQKDKAATAAATAEATAEGKARGEAKVALPGARVALNQAIKQVDAIINHPALPQVTGRYLASVAMPGSKEEELNSMIEQATSAAFLQAFEVLKGGGAITEKEGEKAQTAMSRMKNQRLSTPDYKKAAEDFKDVMRSGLAKLEATAGSGQAAPSMSPAELRKKYGL